MSRLDEWLSERPAPTRVEIACRLAADRFWKDERRSLIVTHPDMPEAAYLLDLPEELAHALPVVLSRLPSLHRPEFTRSFYKRSRGEPDLPADWNAGATRPFAQQLDPATRLSLAAAVVLQVFELIDLSELSRERVADLLRGAAQGDDLARTPATAVEEVSRTIARIRSQPGNDAANDVAAVALAEVLSPSSDNVDLQEVLARCAAAAVETWERQGVLDFLLDVDRLLATGRADLSGTPPAPSGGVPPGLRP